MMGLKQTTPVAPGAAFHRQVTCPGVTVFAAAAGAGTVQREKVRRAPPDQSLRTPCHRC